MSVHPIFLLSLPRSGSTLVQRVLSTYPEVASASEPWLLLPFLTPLEPGMPLNGGWQRTVDEAFREFLATLPGGQEDYLAVLRPLAENLYARASDEGARYFLDKSPPYHWIAGQLFDLFPDARFVFLWRNPLSVLASNIETFCEGRWRPDVYRGTLFNGPRNLAAAYRQHRDRAIGISFEDLVSGGSDPWTRLTNYLDLEFDPASLDDFSAVELSGRMGDPTGVHLYSAVSREPVEKWMKTVNTRMRRAWCERYLRWIGAADLATMGYELSELLESLDSAPCTGGRALADIVDVGRSLARETATSAVSRDRPSGTWSLLRQGGGAAGPWGGS